MASVDVIPSYGLFYNILHILEVAQIHATAPPGLPYTNQPSIHGIVNNLMQIEISSKYTN